MVTAKPQQQQQLGTFTTVRVRVRVRVGPVSATRQLCMNGVYELAVCPPCIYLVRVGEQNLAQGIFIYIYLTVSLCLIPVASLFSGNDARSQPIVLHCVKPTTRMRTKSNKNCTQSTIG